LIYQLGNDYLQRRNDYFRKVTPAQVTRIAKRLLSRPPMIVVVGKGVDGLR
jgi:predicted Zn-dependent peptidase